MEREGQATLTKYQETAVTSRLETRLYGWKGVRSLIHRILNMGNIKHRAPHKHRHSRSIGHSRPSRGWSCRAMLGSSFSPTQFSSCGLGPPLMCHKRPRAFLRNFDRTKSKIKTRACGSVLIFTNVERFAEHEEKDWRGELPFRPPADDRGSTGRAAWRRQRAIEPRRELDYTVMVAGEPRKIVSLPSDQSSAGGLPICKNNFRPEDEDKA